MLSCTALLNKIWYIFLLEYWMAILKSHCSRITNDLGKCSQQNSQWKWILKEHC